MNLDRPFLRRDALDAGHTVHQVRWRRECGAWLPLRRGVYTTSADDHDGDPARVTAVEGAAVAVKLAGDPVVSHESAALLWGIPTLRPPVSDVQLTRPRRGRGAIHDYPGVLLHHASVPASHRTKRSDMPVTTPARTVADLARARSFRAGLVAADAALRLGLCAVEEMLAVCADCTRWPGVRRARAVAQFADPRPESPLESVSRAAFRAYGLPDPKLQVWVTDHHRVDFLWPRQKVIGEADGMAKYADRDVLRQEKARQEYLERRGYLVIRWTWDDVFRRPDAVAGWVNLALHRHR